MIDVAYKVGDEERSHNWAIDSKLELKRTSAYNELGYRSVIDPNNIISITAYGNELALVLRQFRTSGIKIPPYREGGRIIWFDEDAKFIFANIIIDGED